MRVAILGTLVVTNDGNRAKLRGELNRRLLAILAAWAGEPVDEDELCHCLWGGPASDHRANLQPLVSRVRTAIEGVGGDGGCIRKAGNGYVIDLDRDELDAFVFEDRRREAVEAMEQGDAATALDRCEVALRLWRGDALADYAAEPLAVRRAGRLEAFRIDTRRIRLEALLQLRTATTEVVVEAEALSQEAPDDERVLRLLMLAYAQAGRPASAGAAFRRYRDRLRAGAEGAEPGAELADLDRAIATGEPVHDPMPPPDRAAVDRAAVDDGDHHGAPRTFLISTVDTTGRDGVDPAIVTRHLEIVARAAGEHGRIFDHDGAEVAVVFERPLDAVTTARAIAVSLARESSGANAPRARQALHTGAAAPPGDPSPDTAVHRLRRMHAAGHPGQVLVSAATRELVKDHLAEGVQVFGIGSYQFAGGARPERVFQLVEEGSTDVFPPLRTGRAPIGQRPRYTTGFLGREHHVADVVERLQRPGPVTLTGFGGVGKTRLAVEVIERMSATEAPGGICYCDVTLADDGDELVERLLLSRGLPVQPEVDLREQLIRSLDRSDVLLVLDGCDRLRREVGRLVREILASTTGVRILVTSQRRLDVTGEQVVRLAPLTVPAPGDLRPHTAPAVLLLHDRARRAGATVAARDPDLAELARRLDGLPLAIELVGPMLNSFSAAELADRIAHCLEMPNDSPDVPRHHRTLRATFEWSYDLLPEPARRLLNALSLFRGHWSLEMAESVAAAVGVDVDDVMHLTTHMVEQALVRVEVPPTGTARYTMLGTLRAHATERLRQSKRYDDVADLHSRYFLDLAERAVPHRGGPDEPAWAGQVLVEYDDFRVAFRWMVDTGRVVDALRLVVALTQDLLMRERLEVGRWAAELAEHRALADDPRRAEALGLAATAAMLRVQMVEAERLAKAALAIEAETGAAPSWTAHNVMAMTAAARGVAGSGWTDHLRVMDARSQATGDPFPAAVALWNRALVARETRSAAHMVPAAEALVALGNAHDCLSIRSMGLLMLGSAAVVGDRREAARDLFREALGAAEAAHTTLVVHQVRRELAEISTSTTDDVLADLRRIAQAFADSGNVAEQVRTARSMVQRLVDVGARRQAACVVEVLGRTHARPAITSLAVLVHEGLTPAEQADARARAGRMQLEDLAAYLGAVVDRLSSAQGTGTSDGDDGDDDDDNDDDNEEGVG